MEVVGGDTDANSEQDGHRPAITIRDDLEG